MGSRVLHFPQRLPEGTHMLRITTGGVQRNAVQLLVGKPRTLITSVVTTTGKMG
ncbi:MAG: hypothetical protein H7Y20_02895 [Bryobacteraceae bacterium]|nr:hypothetical protein [Bryobacteraceae bacterium]